MTPPRADLEILQKIIWRYAIKIAVVWPGTSQSWPITACIKNLLPICSWMCSLMARSFPGVMLHIESHQSLLVWKRFDPTYLEYISISWDVPIQACQIYFPSTDNKVSTVICLHIFYRNVVPYLKCVKSPTVDTSPRACSSQFVSTCSNSRWIWKCSKYQKIIVSKWHWIVFWNAT